MSNVCDGRLAAWPITERRSSFRDSALTPTSRESGELAVHTSSLAGGSSFGFAKSLEGKDTVRYGGQPKLVLFLVKPLLAMTQSKPGTFG